MSSANDRLRPKFTLSGPPSRVGSPTPSLLREELLEKSLDDVPMDVYDATLPPWRAAVRRKLVASVHVESALIAKMQASSGDAIRTPWLDSYFLYTSALGSHTFFMMFLPMLFFFGYDQLGRGLIVLLALGIYITSVAKDLFCSPRPFAPPVTRLTIGTHHLEYGMPSTHSTNSVSLALMFFAHIHELAYPPFPATPSVSFPTYVACSVGLAAYATSIVFGRLYTAMHSFADCVVGIAIGALLWLAHTSFAGIPLTLTLALPAPLAAALRLPAAATAAYTYRATLLRGWGWGAHLDAWVQRTPSSLRVPLTLVPLALLAVNQHPQPVDDCPCFEDAIAIGSVALGMLLGRWGAVRWGAHAPIRALMPGSGWMATTDGAYARVPPTWMDLGVWWGAAVSKMVFGILAIFVWRLLAKAALHRALPPTFRFLATLMRLPHRRFYTPATDYTRVPPLDALRPIPSVIDLPATAGVEVGGIGSGSGVLANGSRHAHGNGNGHGHGNGKGGLRRRAEAVEAARGGGAAVRESESEPADDAGAGPVKHYDADVLTKLIVYAGIAVIACEGMPVLFETVGWGVRPWP
ncbi:sphingosine-1-phosphate phosphatase [Mycena pura]|uniref:Sphingosine-1-phosphate phosphatase n=1 Tax=Mycena pura TaxID=153505 RepID=A0AAD6Y4N3_9AGAR|nr:sphingosine-1-phosphate phosphatase [Mycena pura]